MADISNHDTMTDKESDTLRRLKDAGVKYVSPAYVDMHGIPKGKVVPISHFSNAVRGSELYTGAALDGVPQAISDEEVASHPDLDSGIILPWKRDMAWFASDLHYKGDRFESCSRNILNRVMDSYAAYGLIPQLGVEAEFFVLRDTDDNPLGIVSTRSIQDKSAYDLARMIDNMHWMDDLVEAMNELGWAVYSFDHEDGIGQFEVDFDYADARTMSDRFVFFRMMAHEIARKHGYYATFMPKVFPNRAGSGAHFNLSCKDAKTGENLFQAPLDGRGNKLSKLGYQFIAGVLRHLGAISAVAAPTVNSYKRLIIRGSASGTTWAPVFMCYGGNNRTNALRIPLPGGRVELRLADAACNPYLASALVLAAGLEGIEQDLDPGEPMHDNMYFKSAEELETLGVRHLPRDLDQALDAFEADSLTKKVFGEHMHRCWLEYKRDEWLSYTSHVSEWEMQRYLKMF